MVWEKWSAPPSGRSSRFTLVTTANFRPRVATASATRWGSSGSTVPGLPLPMLQKPQWRVQISPSSMKVAVRWTPQHSCWLGQRASSQTVTSFLLRMRRSTSAVTSAAGTLIFSQDGRGPGRTGGRAMP